MILHTQEILLGIASCTHLAMLCDLEAMKIEAERDFDNFDPNDEVLLRCFTIPALLDSLRAGRFDTGQGAKTEKVLIWALGMHLDDEAGKLTEPVFAGLVAMFDALVDEDIQGWWAHISEEYKDENHPAFQQRKDSLAATLSEWRNRRSNDVVSATAAK